MSPRPTRPPRRRTASQALVLATLVGLGLGARRADAHLAPPTVRADRTLTLTLGERTTLLYALRLSSPELSRVRADADANRDGQLGPDEAAQLLTRWTAALRKQVSLAAGKDRVGFSFPLEVKSFEIGREAVGLEGPVALPTSLPASATEPVPGARVAWTFDLRMGGNDDRLVLEDAVDFVPIDHSEVFVKDSAARRLLGLGVDEQRLGVASQLSWVDAGSGEKKRLVHVTWTPPPARPWWMAPLVLVLGIAIAGATLWSVRH